MATGNEFTHMALKRTTRRKVKILAGVLEQNIYDLFEYWADQEWKQARKNGLVKDEMLEVADKEGVKA